MIEDPGAARSDTADWTWVLERVCWQCGFDASVVGQDNLEAVIAAAGPGFARVLHERDAEQRPAPGVWSPQEYVCHVRDVCRVMTARLDAILARQGESTVRFDSWDQNAAGEQYWREDRLVVKAEVAESIATAATSFGGVTGDQWCWRGVRGDGAEFTALALGRYLAHELQHHQWDVDTHGPSK